MNRAAEPYRKVVDIVNGFQAARVLHVAVALDVFTRLSDEGKTAAQLAVLLHIDPITTELMLHALAASGLLRHDHDRFVASPVAQTYLVRGGPHYLGHLVAVQARRWESWGDLESALRDGPAPQRAAALAAMDGEQVAAWHELLLAHGEVRQLARALPLRRCRTLLEVGAGSGTLAALCCRAFADLHAIVLESPHELAATQRLLCSFDVTGRVATLAADLRSDAIPGAPYDAALVSHPRHDSGSASIGVLLRRVYEALAPGAWVVVRPHLVAHDPTAGAFAALAAWLDGRGRFASLAEIREGLLAADFRDVTPFAPDPSATGTLLIAQRAGAGKLASLLSGPASARLGPVTRMDPSTNGRDEAWIARPKLSLTTAPRTRHNAATTAKRRGEGRTRPGAPRRKPASRSEKRTRPRS
jgi:precorrin-6B methylase 2